MIRSPPTQLPLVAKSGQICSRSSQGFEGSYANHDNSNHPLWLSVTARRVNLPRNGRMFLARTFQPSPYSGIPCRWFRPVSCATSACTVRENRLGLALQALLAMSRLCGHPHEVGDAVTTTRYELLNRPTKLALVPPEF
jgi:hypothetical protein